jgi:hypothetical protein
MNVDLSGPGCTAGFSERVPWVLTWTTALLLFLVVVVSADSAWRALGYRPSVADSPALWKYWYRYVSCGQRRAIAIIGASRIQSGVSAPWLRKRLPQYRIAQLGKASGRSPIGVLRALAYDDRFKGIVICDALAPYFIREMWESQRSYYEYPARFQDRVNALLSASVQSILAIRNERTGMHAALKHLADYARLPPDPRVQMKVDRSNELDFPPIAILETARARNALRYRFLYETAYHPPPTELDDSLQQVDGFVRRIRDRGGEVVFVRMPSSGERLQIEEEYHPKAEYWDRFAAMSSGIWIHWTELKGIGTLACPDDSHLDYRGARLFTDALLDELRKRGVVTAE